MELLFYENEVRTNRIVAIVLLFWGILYEVLSVLTMLGLYHLGRVSIEAVIRIVGLILITMFLCAKLLKYDHPKLKIILLLGIIFACAAVYIFFPLDVIFMLYGPIVMSAMYYEKKIVLHTFGLTYFIFLTLQFLNVWGEFYLEDVRAFHAWQGLQVWGLPEEVILYHVVPQTAGMLLTAWVACNIAAKGRTLVSEEAKMTAEATAMASELHAAADIQLASLPARSFSTRENNLFLQAFIRPAKIVGGDFYDYFFAGNNHLVFLVADVSDKGLSAAMFMMQARSAIRNAVQQGKDLQEAVNLANLALCANNPENMFVTMWIGTVNVHTGVGKYVNCGHNPAMLRQSAGNVTKLENKPDLILGTFDFASYTAYPMRLKKGDTLILYTDGITDSMNPAGESFGETGIIESMKLMSSNVTENCELLIHRVDAFSDGADQFDDMTLMGVHFSDYDQPIKRELDCIANYENQEKAIDMLEAVLAEVNCPIRVCRSVQIAVDEMCANVADYAYPDGEGMMKITMLAGENFIYVCIEDSGIYFNPLDVEFSEDRDKLAIGGLGIHLVKETMDVLKYSRVDDTNRFVMTKIWDC